MMRQNRNRNGKACQTTLLCGFIVPHSNIFPLHFKYLQQIMGSVPILAFCFGSCQQTHVTKWQLFRMQWVTKIPLLFAKSHYVEIGAMHQHREARKMQSDCRILSVIAELPHQDTSFLSKRLLNHFSNIYKARDHFLLQCLDRQKSISYYLLVRLMNNRK